MPSNRRALPGLPAILLVLAALALGACGDDDGDTTMNSGDGGGAQDTGSYGAEPDELAPSGDAVRSAKVEIADFAYGPDPVTIEEGGKVIWINRDAEPHTATADDGSFDTGTLEEGKLKSESFKQPGEYTYHCDLHPEMTGTVEVVESG